MNGWLADTNVISETRKLRPSFTVLSFLAQLPKGSLWVSSVSLAELQYGIDLLEDDAKKEVFRVWLQDEIRPLFAGRILEASEAVLLRWRHLVGAGKRTGRTYSLPDSLIAATALVYGLTVVTRNVRDFEGTGVAVFNPWESEIPSI